MSSTRDTNRDRFAETTYHLVVRELDDGTVVFQDEENPAAWLESSPDISIEIDGRWR